MNKQESDILNVILQYHCRNQRALAERCGFSLGMVNRSVKALQGQLTATVHAEADDGPLAASLLPLLCEKAGRVLFNGYPTGVEVCDAMVHGGPWPATTDARGTSVGSRAIERFLRPVCLQNAPAALLPPALQDANPLNLLRLVNGQWTREAISSSH